MYAQHDGECDLCFGPVFEGETAIAFHSVYGWIHADPEECDSSDDEDEPFACSE